jgi:hypothetical protein
MPLPLNWIKHPVHGVLSPELTSEDLEFSKYDRIHEYYQSVKLLWLIRTSHLSDDLKLDVKESTPADVCQTLTNAVKLGAMDTGWAEEYFQISEEISWRMNGFPRDFLKQTRRLKSVLSNPPNYEPTPASQPKLSKKSCGFHFLRLPTNVRERIYRLLLVRGSIEIGDFDFGIEPKGLLRRTEYAVYDAKTRRPRRTT